MIRNIVEIDSEKCNGCGLCITACHEAAIQMVDGKAVLVDDKYCDGLGNCLPACPTDAIKIIERETVDFDEDAVEERIQTLKNEEAEEKKEDIPPMACGCPGTMARKIERSKNKAPEAVKVEAPLSGKVDSELLNWPVQLKLVNPQADYFYNADLLVSADCCAYAYGDFHRDYLKDRPVVIGCPKLDDVEFYKEKLKLIINSNSLKSITVLRMSVPCCGGIVQAVKQAMLETGTILPYQEVVIGPEGKVL